MLSNLKTLAPLDPRQRYTIEEALMYLRLSRARLYAKVHAGEIALLKDGRRTFVNGGDIVRLSAPPAKPVTLEHKGITAPGRKR